MTEHESDKPWDLIVIGAGSGGLATSKRAAAHGARVAVIEASRAGGTCVIRGCIPKKLMVYASQLGQSRELALDYGWKDKLGSIDWAHLKTFRDNVVKNLEAMHMRNLEKAGVTFIAGHASIEAPGKVRVGENILSASKIVIASGAAPTMAPIAGMQHCISSDGFWELEKQPKQAIVIGGGYIALELACALQGLGTQTHLLVRSKILSGFDQEISEHLEATLIKTGLTIHRPVHVNEVTKTDSGTRVSFTDIDGKHHDLEADVSTLVATGRHPNTENLNLESVGIKTGPAGEILVNTQDQTSCDGIFAVGDVTLRTMLTPVAIKSGRLLADRLYHGATATMDYGNIPTAVFSQPPVGVVGLTESEAHKEFGDNVAVYRSEFGGLLFSPTPKERTVRTLMKLIVHSQTDKVLGCHMVGPDAAEIIQGFAVAMQAGATKADFDRTVAIHPSSAEEFVLMS